MMKFFRKNTKTLLAVFMSLLLIVWLGGTALQNMFEGGRGYGNEVIARAFGHEVRQQDLARVASQGEVGRSLVRSWNMPWATLVARMSGDNQQLFNTIMMDGRREPLSLEEWYLLDAEADRKDVHVSAEAVNQLKANIPPEYLMQIRDSRRLSMDQIDAAIRAYLRIEQAVVQAAESITVSEADIQDFVRDTAERVKVRMVTVDANKLIDSDYQPSQEEIAAQFEKYKDEPAGGPGQYGYQLPPATQIEYIQIKIDELAKAQTVTDDEAYEYWVNHKSEFRRPQPPTTQPTTRPEEPKPYDTFTEAKPDVINKLAEQKASSVAGRLSDELIRQLSRSWADQPTTRPGGYREPPADATTADVYPKVIAGLQGKYGDAVQYGQTPLASVNDLMSTPIGRAWAFGDSASRVMFREAALMVAGLDQGERPDGPAARLYRNVYETAGEPLEDSQGNLYVFRNVAVRPPQAPESVEEVRDKVVQDLRREKATEQARQIAEQLAEQARASGLEAAFEADAALKEKLGEKALQTPDPFARKFVYPAGGIPQMIEGFVPGVGRDPELIELAFGMADRTATQPTPVAVHKQENRQRYIVVEFDKFVPVTREEYNDMRMQARSFLLMTKRLEFVLDWFRHEEIVARTGYEEIVPEPADEAGESPSEEAPAEAGV